MPTSSRPTHATPTRPLLSRRAALGAMGVGLGAAAVGGTAMLRRGNVLRAESSVGPGGADGQAPLRVALVTDLHAPHYWASVDELAEKVRRFDPHLLFVAGDSIDRQHEEAQVRVFDALPARHGKFASLGNHEHWSGCDFGLLRREYERAGVRLLVNETATVDVDGRTAHVVGLDDWRAGRPDYSLVRDDRAPWRSAAQRFVLAHCPVAFDDLRRASALPFDALAGHTHGGQISPFGVPIFLPLGSGSYFKGWYGEARTRQRLYVSRGVGNMGPPFRVGAPPELALLTF